MNSGCDADEYWDLRELNERDGDKFKPFWNECSKHLELEVGTGAEERRAASDGSVSYASSIISVPIFIRDVAEKLHSQPGFKNAPIPSRSTVELQFYPRDPHKLSAGRFTSRLKVRREMQSRILRKSNIDSHATNALGKYFKTKTVSVRDLARELDVLRSESLLKLTPLIVCYGSADKQAIPFGPPGLPISSGVKALGPVLVNIDSAGLLTLDHDCGRAGTLTVSVDLEMVIPDTAGDSWFDGTLHVALRNTTFQPSNGFQHAAQLLQLLRSKGEPPIYLALETDRGSDHNSNHLVNKLALIALQRCAGILKLCLRHPAGGQSYSLTHERAMALLNLGIQHVSLARGSMSEDCEKMAKSCSSMAATRHKAGRGPPPKSKRKGKQAEIPTDETEEADKVRVRVRVRARARARARVRIRPGVRLILRVGQGLLTLTLTVTRTPAATMRMRARARARARTMLAPTSCRASYRCAPTPTPRRLSTSSNGAATGTRATPGSQRPTSREPRSSSRSSRRSWRRRRRRHRRSESSLRRRR